MSDNGKVVDLVDAGVPADQGLSSLGLVMQLAGNVFAAYAALLSLSALLPGRTQTLWLFVLGGLSVARSLLHRSAGSQLLYGTGGDGRGDRFAGIRRYIIAGLIHSAAIGLLLTAELHVPVRAAFGIAAGLATWPAVLAALIKLPRFRRFRDDLPIAEDKGFESTSILMTVFGLCGVIATGTVLLFMLELPGAQLQRGPGVLVVLAVGMLLVRSVLHVQAGASGLRETSIDRSVELANRYANFGIITSLCVSGALLIVMMASAASIAGLAVVSGLCWMLAAWPTIIRRFFSDRQFADLLAGAQAPIHRRAPDCGLTGLGWMLIAYAAFSVSLLIPGLVVGHGEGMWQSVFSLRDALGGHSTWLSLGLVALEAAAGYELVRMSRRSRVVATVYGVAGAVVTAYLNWPMIESLHHLHGLFDQDQLMMVAPVALELILPLATILLVNRSISPTARARFRPRPDGATPA